MFELLFVVGSHRSHVEGRVLGSRQYYGWGHRKMRKGLRVVDGKAPWCKGSYVVVRAVNMGRRSSGCVLVSWVSFEWDLPRVKSWFGSLSHDLSNSKLLCVSLLCVPGSGLLFLAGPRAWQERDTFSFGMPGVQYDGVSDICHQTESIHR